MAILKRTDLKAKGLTDEQIDYIMTESNRSLAANYILASDAQAKVDEAVKAAAAQAPAVDIKTTQEYIDLQDERDMLLAISGDDFACVKPKFRKDVYKMLDRSEKAPSVADQFKAIGERYEEFFTAPAQQPEDEPAKQPSFGAPTQGSAPTGKSGPSFMDTWGFVPKKN